MHLHCCVFFLAFLCLIRLVVYNQKLQTYLKTHHYDRWKEFIGEDTELFRNIYLKPINSDKSYFHFTVWSSDDLDDKQVMIIGDIFEQEYWVF